MLPTIGRIVYYRGQDGITRPATVTKAHGEFCIDLYVFPINNTDIDCYSKSSVTHADPEQEPTCLNSWHWMPYQIQQAAKVSDQISVSSSSQSDVNSLRVECLHLAAQSLGATHHHDVVEAAKAFEAYIKGEKK